LISGEFKYLRPRKTDVQQKPNKERTSRNIPTLLSHKAVTIAGESFVVLGAVGKVAGDAARVLVPTAAATLRAVSIASIIVGAVLTPIFAAWSFYSTGQRMNEELHSICDDLVIILQYFAVDRCDDCCQKIQPSVLLPSHQDSSSSDED
jgi:hypothetical protein